MNPKYLILLFTALVGGALSLYIMDQESKTEFETDSHNGHDHESTVQVANRGETRVTLKPGYDQIGRLQGKVPKGWKREKPTSSMRIAQFQIPGENGNGEMVVFSGIGGSVDANLKRWYGQFKSESGRSISETAETIHTQVNGMDVTFSFVRGTYLKSSRGMGGTSTEYPKYALMTAIVIALDGPYYFKGTGPETILDSEKEIFIGFIKSIYQL